MGEKVLRIRVEVDEKGQMHSISLISAKQASALLGQTSLTAINRLMENEVVRYIQIGGTRVLIAKDVEKHIEDKERKKELREKKRKKK